MKALFLNCTLKRSPETSNTRALIDKIAALYHEHGVDTEVVRVVDWNIPFGMAHKVEGAQDDWPDLFAKIEECDILVIASPIWMGHRASLCQLVMERLDGSSTRTNDLGQYPLYNKVAACVVTGNEDGAHSVAESVLYNLTHFGATVPANADCYWVGDAGPGLSYIEAHGEQSPYVNRTARLLVANTTWMARQLKAHPYPTDIHAIEKAASRQSDSEFQVQYGR